MKHGVIKGIIGILLCCVPIVAQQQSLAKVHPVRQLRRYSTGGIFGSGGLSSQEVSKIEADQQASTEVVIKFTHAATEKTIALPDTLTNKMSARSSFRLQSGTVEVPAVFEKAVELFKETFDDKDTKALLVAKLQEQPLSVLISLYNFCRLYAVSSQYQASVLSALLADIRFFKALVEHPEGNIFKDLMEEQQMLGEENELRHAQKLTKEYMHKITGDAVYTALDPLSLGLFINAIYPTVDGKRIALTALNHLRIYGEQTGAGGHKKWKELFKMDCKGRIQEVIWNPEAHRFAILYEVTVKNEDKDAQEIHIRIYEWREDTFQKLPRPIRFIPHAWHQIAWGNNFDRCIMMRNRLVQIADFQEGRSYGSTAQIDPGHIKKSFLNQAGNQLAIWGGDHRLQLYSLEKSKQIAQYVIPEIIVGNVHASPDGKGFLFAAPRMDIGTSAYMVGCQGTAIPLAQDVQGEIDQVVWGKNRDYIALLVNKSDIHVYQCCGNMGYKKVHTIVYDHEERHLIRAIFANEDMSKIIVWLDNYTVLVYQRILDRAGRLSYRKTQEIKSSRMIQAVHVNTTVDRIMLQIINNTVEIYAVDSQQLLPINQILLLPALQKCLSYAEMSPLLTRHKRVLAELIERYGALYGAWIEEAWGTSILNCCERCTKFTRTHKVEVLGVSLVVAALVCFGQHMQNRFGG